MLDDGPGDGEAVEGGGAAADFIEENEAAGVAWLRMAATSDISTKKRGAAAGEIVAGADAREDAIDDGSLAWRAGTKQPICAIKTMSAA